MKFLRIDHADGRYWTHPLTAEKVAEAEAADCTVATLDDDSYAAYQRHCADDGVWQALWRSIANERWIRQRERDLLPREEAAREIDRLKAELASAQRSADFFEDEWDLAVGRRPGAARAARAHALSVATCHANEDGCYTCIYPQPGCDVDALARDDWRVAAVAILETYNVSLGEEGTRRQGCCCGHGHLHLGPDVAAKLRAAGFLVEDNTECE